MYDHYIAVDWAQKNMAIARMTRTSNKVSVIDVPADIGELKLYLSQLKGKKVLTFEETTTSQWLYTELKASVDELIVCDPYRNRLLSEGPKTDKIDAAKLCYLLRSNLLKAVFHSGDEFIRLRKLVSGYEDLIKSGVRLKNQRAALFRAKGKSKDETDLEDSSEVFVLRGIDERIEAYEKEKARYEAEFYNQYKKHQFIRNLESITGIGVIGAVKIAAYVINPFRFRTKGKYLSYSGLIRHDKISGGKNYGSKKPRYCRPLKTVYKIGALNIIGPNSKSPLKAYYEFLIREKGYAEFNARHAVARKLAIISWGVFKRGKDFNASGLTIKA